MLTESGPVMRETPTPVAGPGEVVVRLAHGAISGADVQFATIASAMKNGYRGVLGHEGCGVVVSAGPATRPGAPDPARFIGKLVAINSVIACAKCERCRSGVATHCLQREVLGLGIGNDAAAPKRGTLGQFIAVPATAVELVPAKVSAQSAALANTIAGVLHAARFVRIEHKTYVTVLGDGATGLLMAQWLVRANASVRVLGTRPDRLALCERWGIKHRDISDAGQRNDQDVVIDCTGSPEGFELAMRFVRPRGKVIVKVLPAPMQSEFSGFAAEMASISPAAHPNSVAKSNAGFRPDLSWAMSGEVEVAFAGHGTLSDALAALVREELDVTPFLSPRVAFDRAASGFAMVRDQRAIRVVVDFAQ
ncbi:MAG: alcohol dehydrogenase catalytic domain-containing protein [Phycisphaerales bacterium]